MTIDFIEVYDNALSSERCKEIISYIHMHNLIKGGSQANNGKTMFDKEVKEDWEVPGQLTRFPGLHSKPTQYIMECLHEYTKQYREKYPSIDTALASWNVSAEYNLQKYDPGQGYHQVHCEAGTLQTSPRVAVWMIYLNTVIDKGGTRFEVYDKELDAVEGRLVIWPAYWTHTHHGIVSETQEKYIATGWYSFQGENELGIYS